MANTMMANLAIIMLDDQWNAHDPFVMHDEYDAKKSTIITTTMKGCYALLINGKTYINREEAGNHPNAV